MIRQALLNRGLDISTAKFVKVMDITTKDIMYNQVRFGKKTTLEEVLEVAERAASLIKKCS